MQIDIEKLRTLGKDTYKKHNPSDFFLKVKELNLGYIPSFDRDIQTSASVISTSGSSIENRIIGDNIRIPTFEIVSRNSIRYSEINRRSNICEKIVIAATREVIKQQNSNLIACFTTQIPHIIVREDASTTTDGNSLVSIVNGFSRENMLELIEIMNNRDLICETIVMSPETFTEMMLWDNLFGFELVKPVDYCNMILVGKFMFANVFLSKDVDLHVIALPSAEKLGHIPLRDFDVVVYDRDMEKIITVYLDSGMGVVNTNNVFYGVRTM